MRVNFRGKNVNITNELKGQRNVFLCHWNMYVLEVKKVDAFDSDSDPDWLYLVQRNGMYICQGTVSAKTCKMSDAVQKCFDKIDKDIDNIECVIAHYLSHLKTLAQYRECRCPYCGSKKIFKFRMDSDWASGAGDYNAINDSKYYTKEEFEYDSFDRPDVEIFHCGECNHFFE